MSLTVTPPYKNLPVTGLPSKWIAVAGKMTTVTVAVQRKDVAGSVTMSSNGTNRRFSFPTNLSGVITINPGDSIYIDFGPLTGLYTILSVTYPGGTSTLIVTTDLYVGLPLFGPGFGNFITARPNYYVRAKYLKYNGSSFVTFGSGTLHRPNPVGLLSLDIAGVMASALSLADEFTHTVENKRDTNLSARMQFQFAEGWNINGVATDQAYGATYDVNAVNAAMQLQHKGGANMLEFMVEHTGTDKAKLLSQIGRATYWPGLPFDISFLYDADANVTSFLKRFTELYRNGLGVGLKDTLLDNTATNYLNRLTMEKTPLREIGIDKIKVYLGYDGFAAVKRYVDVDYVDDDFIIVI